MAPTGISRFSSVWSFNPHQASVTWVVTAFRKTGNIHGFLETTFKTWTLSLPQHSVAKIRNKDSLSSEGEEINSSAWGEGLKIAL